MEYLSRITYSATGTVNYFAVPIAYMKKTDIHVLVDGVESAYVWLDDKTVQLSPTPAVGTQVEIYRDVEKKKRVAVFKDGSFLTESDMNLSATQQFMVSQEAYDLARISTAESEDTREKALEAIDVSQQAAADSAAALNVVSGMQESVDSAAESAESAAATAKEALLTAAESSHAHLNKSVLDEFGTTGSNELIFNGDKIALTDDLSVLVQTDAANASAESFRSLVGMPEVEEDIAELQAEMASTGSTVTAIDSRVSVLENEAGKTLSIAPQTIIAGATGVIPSGWNSGDCDEPAAHIVTSGTNELTIVAGLQVAAGVEGSVYVSKPLAEDTTLDISDLINTTKGTGYIYSDVSTDGSQSFGYTAYKPQIGLSSTETYDSVLPVFNSATLSGIGTVSASSKLSGYDGYKAFNQTTDNESDCWSTSEGNSAGWLRWVGDAALDNYIAIGYRIYRRNYAAYNFAPKSWTFKIGSGVTPDTTVDTRSNITDWVVGTPNTFLFETPIDGSNIQSFELNVTASQGSSYVQVGRLELIYAYKSDFYNTANHTHYDKDGNILRRVYIGEFVVVGGALVRLINCQHGIVCTLPVKSDIEVNSKCYIDSPYFGCCLVEVRIYHENKWGIPGWIYSADGYGVKANMTDGVISVQSGSSYLTAPSAQIGGEFSSATNQPKRAKVTVIRQW